LEPKIASLEERIQAVLAQEEEINDKVVNNTARLDAIDEQCKKVNNWMRTLAGGGGSDAPSDDMLKAMEAEPPSKHQHQHQHHHHADHTSKAA